MVFTKSAASAITYCTFDVGGAYSQYTLLVPAMTSGTTLAFEVAGSDEGTYYPLYHTPTIASAPVQVQIASGLTGVAVGLPNTLGQYFRVQRVATPTDTATTFTVICKG
jgi:hypothetical protein